MAPNINTEIQDVAVTCNNPLAHNMGSHTTAAVLQYVEHAISHDENGFVSENSLESAVHCFSR